MECVNEHSVFSKSDFGEKLKSVRNRINKGFTGTDLKIPKSENRKPSHGEGVCRGKISYETYDRETLGCKPDILVKTWCTGLGAGD